MRLTVPAIALSVLLAVPLGAAQRTFVSAETGSDANPCTRSAPCRSFTAALAVTDYGGEVVALDSGGYGAFNVSASATIDAPAGVAAAITVFAGNGIAFLGGAADRLIVRGVQLTGLGGTNGIDYHTGAAVHLERVLVTGFTFGAKAGFSAGLLSVADSAFIGNHDGMQVGGLSAEVGAIVTGSRFEGNSNQAISALQGADVTIRDTVVSGNNLGLNVTAFEASTATRVAVERSVFSANTLAMISVQGSGVSRVWVSDTTIAFNGTGVQPGHISAAPIFSRSNNTLRGNGVNGAFTGPFTAD